MLINFRNALMAGKRKPYQCELEFLESTGTQYIPTGVTPNENTRWDLTVQFPASGAFMAMGAIYAGTPREMFIIGREGNDNLNISFGAPDHPLTIKGLNAVHTMTLDAPNLTWTVDGTSGTFDSATLPHIAQIVLFARNRSSTQGISLDAYCTSTRIYSCKIYQNNVLVRDLIPVLDWSGVACMYDRVSGKLFYNAGTGDFVAGPEIHAVEYIESTGTQYINTGIVATNSHGVRIDIATAQKEGTVNTRIFGTHEGNTRFGFALYGKADANDAFFGWDAATALDATIPQRFVASLNYQNDRKAIFNGTTYISSLGTLGSLTQSIYLLNANYGGAPFADQYVVGKLYGAEITVGSDVANHYIPVRVGTDSTWEGAMMDTLTRRIYRNAGTGAFTYGNDLPYPIPA